MLCPSLLRSEVSAAYLSFRNFVPTFGLIYRRQSDTVIHSNELTPTLDALSKETRIIISWQPHITIMCNINQPAYPHWDTSDYSYIGLLAAKLNVGVRGSFRLALVEQPYEVHIRINIVGWSNGYIRNRRPLEWFRGDVPTHVSFASARLNFVTDKNTMTLNELLEGRIVGVYLFHQGRS
jgi:hypothetical protein